MLDLLNKTYLLLEKVSISIQKDDFKNLEVLLKKIDSNINILKNNNINLNETNKDILVKIDKKYFSIIKFAKKKNIDNQKIIKNFGKQIRLLSKYKKKKIIKNIFEVQG